MWGLLVFRTLREALDAGFKVYDRTSDGGFIVRRQRDNRWELAIVRPAAK